MKPIQRCAAIVAAATLLASCGGGGGGGAKATPVTPTVITTSGPAATGTAIARGSLTVKFPATFHVAKLAAGSTRTVRGTNTTQRTPAYVNPSGGYYLDIFVDGVPAVDPSDAGIGNVSNTTDGTQTFSFPLYSTSAHKIVAIETDNGLYSGSLLAIGELDISAGAFSPGDAPSFGLTMLMNAVGIGLVSNLTNGNDAQACLADAKTGTCGFPYNAPTCVNSSSGPVFAYTVDPTGGFVTNGGAGVTIPQLTGWLSQPANLGNSVSGAPLGSGYTLNFPATSGDLQVRLSALNPATAVFNDFTNPPATPMPLLYPGIDALANQNSAVSGLITQTIGQWGATTSSNNVFTAVGTIAPSNPNFC